MDLFCIRGGARSEKFVRELVQRSNSGEVGELVARALSLFADVLDHQLDGGTVTITDRDGSTRQLPRLDDWTPRGQTDEDEEEKTPPTQPSEG